MGLIPLATFWVAWKERNIRAFKGIEANFNKIKNSWFQTLGFLIKGYPICFCMDLGDFINILFDI